MRKYKPQAWLRLFIGWGLDVSTVAGIWYSSSSEVGKLWDYKNKEVDHLFELGSITEDTDERAEIYQRIHKIIYKDQPACFLFFPVGYSAINSDFKNTDEYFDLYTPTYTMKDWYVERR